MKNLNFLLSLSSFLLLSLASGRISAQSVQVKFDSKVICCDSLNMPENTSAKELLNLLPELLQRPQDTPFPTYEILVNGMPLGEGKDEVLSQLRIVDLEEIEVEESPLASYLQNGEGGGINLVLRSHGSKTDKIWGSTDISVAYPLDITPQVLLGHRSGKWMVRGLLLGNVYNNNPTVTNATFNDSGVLQSSQTNNQADRYRCQLARAYIQYQPSAKDVLNLNVSETYKYHKENENAASDGEQVSSEKNEAVTLHTYFNWNHTFAPRTALHFECQYIYNPGETNSIIPQVQLFNTDFTSHTVAGKLEYNTALLPASVKTQLKLAAGCNLNGSFNSNNIKKEDLVGFSSCDVNPQNNTYFAQPYLSLILAAGKFRMKVNAEFQHFAYRVSRLEQSYDDVSNDFTGKLMMEYHFTSHQNLRLIVDRKLKRPSDEQIFPFLYFNPSSGTYFKGEPTLSPTLSHEVRLDYVSDYKWGEHSLMLDMSTSYNNISDIISTFQTEQGSVNPGVIGMSLWYNSYRNLGTSHILNANLMALYSYKALTLSLTGNVYHSGQYVGESTDYRTYFNLAFFSQFRLKDGWQGSAKMTYYSKVHASGVTLGDCAVANMSIGRRWKNVFIYVYDQIALQKNAEDSTSKSDGSILYRTYEMVPNAVGVGVKYSF